MDTYHCARFLLAMVVRSIRQLDDVVAEVDRRLR